jgi:hypothetical protein
VGWHLGAALLLRAGCQVLGHKEVDLYADFDLAYLLGAFPTVLGRRGRRAWESVMNTAIAFPALLLALGVASAPPYARLTYTLASSVSGSDYVCAARILGVRRSRLMLRHVLPNIAEPLIVTTTLQVGGMLVALSALSFLGLGVQPPDYDWGRLLSENLNRIYTAPAAALAPGVAIVVAGLVFNALGETAAALVRAEPAAGARTAGRRRSCGAPRRTTAGPVRATTGGRETGGPVADAAAYALRVHDLDVVFPGPSGPLHTVLGVTLDVRRGETVGIVGESGSGKTLTAMAIAGLVPEPGRVTASRMEIWRGPASNSSVGAASTMRPRYITAMTSLTYRTTLRLCEMNSIEAPGGTPGPCVRPSGAGSFAARNPDRPPLQTTCGWHRHCGREIDAPVGDPAGLGAAYEACGAVGGDAQGPLAVGAGGSSVPSAAG